MLVCLLAVGPATKWWSGRTPPLLYTSWDRLDGWMGEVHPHFQHIVDLFKHKCKSVRMQQEGRKKDDTSRLLQMNVLLLEKHKFNPRKGPWEYAGWNRWKTLNTQHTLLDKYVCNSSKGKRSYVAQRRQQTKFGDKTKLQATTPGLLSLNLQLLFVFVERNRLKRIFVKGSWRTIQNVSPSYMKNKDPEYWGHSNTLSTKLQNF